MTTEFGESVRLRRVRLGLTVAQVARSTGVPAAFIRALEEGRRDRGAPSPAYDEAWCSLLSRTMDRAEARVDRGLPWDATTSSGSAPDPHRAPPTVAAPGDDTPPSGGVQVAVNPVPSQELRTRLPYAQVRVFAAVCVGTAAALLLVWGAQLARTWWNLPTPVPPPVEVAVRVLRPGPLVVSVDGATVLDGAVTRGERFTWRGRQEVVLDVEDPFAVLVDFDGRDISPRGHRDQPRRMVFLAEGEAR